jgi:hypothetical protein
VPFRGVAKCKNQCADKPLRPKGASERQFALSCRHSPRRHSPRRLVVVTARIPYVPSMVCSRSIAGFSGSLAALESLRWHHVDRGPKTCNFVLVEPCCRRTEARRKRRLTVRNTGLSTTSLMRWACRLLSADVQNIRGICPRGRRNGSRIKSR